MNQKKFSVFKSTVVVSVCIFFSRISGFIRDLFFAKFLGTGYYSDIFFTMYKIPNLFRNIFAEGALTTSFVPVISGEMAKGTEKEKIKSFIDTVFSFLFFTILILIFTVEIFMPYLINIIAPTFKNNVNKYLLTIKLSRIVFPFLLMISMTSLLSGILNSLNKFMASSLAPMIINLSFIFFCLLSSVVNIHITYLLAYAILTGGLIQLSLMLYLVKKNGFSVKIIVPKSNDLIKNFMKTFCNAVLSASILQINSLVDAIFATSIASAMSYIYYCERLVQLPLSLIGTAIGISMLPALSKQVVNGGEDRFKLQENCFFIGLFIGLPCFICLNGLASVIVPFLFQGGKFTAESSRAVISCLKLYSLVVPINISIKIIQTIFFANRNTKTPLQASMISLVSNVILNYAFVKFLSYRGILLSTVVSSLINVSFLLYSAYKFQYIKLSLNFIIKILKLIYPNLAISIVIMYLNKFLFVSTSIAKTMIFLKLSVSAVILTVIYFSMTQLLNIIDIKTIIKNNVRKN